MADAPAGLIEIEMVYALRDAQRAEILRVPAGTTLAEALKQSRVMERHPEIAAGSLAIGVCGRRVAPTTVLREYDRIEFYRPLIADPKQARRARARRTGKSKR